MNAALNQREKAKAWVDAWNRHDLEAVLSHYSQDIIFTSPYVLQRFDASGTIHGLTDLRRYIEGSFRRTPDLHFELIHVFEGVDSTVIHYHAVAGRLAAETHVFDETGAICRVYCHYVSPEE